MHLSLGEEKRVYQEKIRNLGGRGLAKETQRFDGVGRCAHYITCDI